MSGRASLRRVLVAAVLATAGQAAAASHPTASAPLPAFNLHPLHWVFLQPLPEEPAVLGRGQQAADLRLGYATVLTTGDSGDAGALLDMEAARVALRWRFGLGSSAELAAEVPFLWMGDGFFDRALDNYHQALHLPRGDRPGRPNNEFAYTVARGNRVYQPSRGGASGLGEASAALKLAPGWATRGPLRGAARLTVKLPTGDADDGLGSGSADAGAGLLLALCWPNLRLDASVDGVYLGGTPDPALRLERRWTTATSLSLAAGGWHGLWGSVQLRHTRTPYGTGVPVVDRDALMLAMGVSGPAGPDWGWSLGFTEDLRVGTSPDFSLFLHLTRAFGAPPQAARGVPGPS